MSGPSGSGPQAFPITALGANYKGQVAAIQLARTFEQHSELARQTETRERAKEAIQASLAAMDEIIEARLAYFKSRSTHDNYWGDWVPNLERDRDAFKAAYATILEICDYRVTL